MTTSYPYSLAAIALLGVGILLASACLDPESHEAPPSESPLTPPGTTPEAPATGLLLAAQDLGLDPYAVGTRWYDYDPRTHVLTPKAEVYRLSRGATPLAQLQIVRYYDARGESGSFTLRTQRYGEEGWEDEAELDQLPNIKQAPLCLSERLEVVPCSRRDEVALVFRISQRVLPEAGFSVSEPGLFLNAPFTPDADAERLRLDTLAAASLDAASALEVPELAPPSAADPQHSRVGWLHDSAQDLEVRRDIQLQVTSSLHAAQWQAVSLTRDDANGALTLELAALCQRVDLSGAQAPFTMDDFSNLSITLPTDTTYSAKLVTLCRAEGDTEVAGDVVGSAATPWGALWPAEPPFDLFVEQYEGRVAVRLGPGTVLWNWTRAMGMGKSQFEPIALDQAWIELFP